jgi:hypothetical protein
MEAMSVSIAPVRQYVNRSLVTMLILGIVNLAVPASALAHAADDETSRSEVTSKTPLLAPGVLQRSITVAAHRAAQQAPQPQSGTAADSRSQKACWTGAALLGGAAVAFVTAWAKHRSWADSGATTTPGAKPPSSVGVSVAIGAVLAGAGIFVTSKTCGQ